MLAFLFLPTVGAEPLSVTLAVSEEGGAYRTFADALRHKLRSDKYVLKIKRADDVLGGSGLYIAVGMKAAILMASRNIPTLNVFVPRTGYDKLLQETVSHSTPRSAIYLDQPLERQVALLTAALPETRTAGVLYSSSLPELANLRRLLSKMNIRLQEREVGKNQNLNAALVSLLEQSDVLLVVPDTEIFNAATIRNILLTSYRKQVPLLGISQAYVKAGALCAVYSTPQQIAEQSVAMIERFVATGVLDAPQYPEQFEVTVNKQVARSLDLRIKDELKLREAIRGGS